MKNKNIDKEFDVLKAPNKCKWYWYVIMVVASLFMKLINKHKLKKINCKGLKAPYVCLSTHASMLDMDMFVLASFPYRPTWVAGYDEFRRGEFLMRGLGLIYKRKFTLDLVSVKHMFYAVKKLKAPLIIYPEARFSLAGITERLDGALGKFIKKLGVPLVIMKNYGHFINSPQWDKHPYRKIKMVSTYEQVLTAKQVEEMSAEEIQKIIEEKMKYNDYDYQKENNLINDNPQRMKNSHQILYKCPHCGKEFMMEGKGTTITCHNCGVTYELDKYGTLHNLNGPSRFKDIPSWYNWERKEVIKEVNSGNYHFEDEVDLEHMYKPSIGLVPVGRIKFIHDYDGMKFTGKTLDGKDFEFFRPSIEQQSLHIEYNYDNHKKEYGPAIDISSTKVTYFGWLVHNKLCLTKLHFATEALFDYNRKKNNIVDNKEE